MHRIRGGRTQWGWDRTSMTPVIGITCSTLMLPGTRGVRRFAIPDYYPRCAMEAGGLPLLFPTIGEEYAASYLARIDGLLLSGGVDVDPVRYDEDPRPELGEVDEERDSFEMALARGAKEQGIPILAICRGVQVLNVACGGTLIQDIRSQVDGALQHDQKALRHSAKSHGIVIEEDTHLHQIAGTTRVRVNSFHHQSVDEVAEGFEVTARAPDGVVEAIEDPNHPFCVGVQWHPERMPADQLTEAIFTRFMQAAAQAARAGARKEKTA